MFDIMIALDGTNVRGQGFVIIGDTPNDVACGRHLDVKSIAVATGRFDEAILREAKPDFLFRDLHDTNRVLEAIRE